MWHKGNAKTCLKPENNFSIYKTVQHKYVICSKLIMPQVLSALEVRKRMCPPTWKLHFTNRSITIDYTSPSQSSQASLRVAELVPTAKMLKKSLNQLNIFLYLNKSPKNLFK